MQTAYKRREIAFYGKRASDYDHPRDNDSLRGNDSSQRTVRAFTSQLEDATVLDLGCGTGRTFSAVQNCTRIVGIDLSTEMLHVAKSKFRNPAREIDLIRGDIFNLPLRENVGAFDAIISIGVLGVHVPVTEGLLSCLRSLLKSDSGRLLFDTNVLRRHWREIFMRRFFEFLGRNPDSPLWIWGFPVQPYAETMFMLRRKLKRTKYLVEKVEKAHFATEGYVVSARVSPVCEGNLGKRASSPLLELPNSKEIY
jgi:SAM-dependent methyltransferase